MDLNEFLNHCLSYPSGDNSQPFRFRIAGEREFEIHHDAGIARHRLNFANLGSCLSFGTLLETISLTAGARGMAMRARLRLPEAAAAPGLQHWATVSLLPTVLALTPPEREMFSALPVRAVRRSRYATEPLPEDLRRCLEQEAAAHLDLRFGFQSRLSPELESALLKVEELSWKDHETALDILRWVRFSKPEAEKSRDGMTWKSLGLPALHKPLVQLLTRVPALYRASARLGGTAGQRRILADFLKHSGGFGWVALNSSAPERVVDAGRVYFRLWLLLTARGYGFQPISLATLPAYGSRFGYLPADWPAGLRPLYDTVIGTLQRDLRVGEEWVPVWGFRTGRAGPVAAENRCLRKPLAAVSIGGLR